MSFFPLKVAEIDSSRRPFMYKLKDLLGDKIPGRYYAEQLRIAPRPGIDFKLEVRNNFDYLTMSSMQVPVIEKPITRRQKAALKRKMTFVVYLNLDCFTSHYFDFNVSQESRKCCTSSLHRQHTSVAKLY